MPAGNMPFSTRPLGFPWPTRDPFLFCVHHLDLYPEGDSNMGPKSSLEGRQLGMDFEVKDGFRMYHGHRVPGFPAHPHRGFETVTLARQGLIDHSDSLGAKARFGHGDVQWMTAGRGIVHCEMFPLVHQVKPNPTELFQIWLNLPAKNKMVEPHFAMLWSPTIPRHTLSDKKGRTSTVTVIAGSFREVKAPSPPPKSWASEPHADVAIWTIQMAPHAELELPGVAEGTLRNLYFFDGDSVCIQEQELTDHSAVELHTSGALSIKNGRVQTELLLLQGRPMSEPVAHHGPFVMNTREELIAAYQDYEHSRFGGWPWASPDPVHDRNQERFAMHPDGSVEHPRKT